ncbi:MAG: glycoside hydrolase family 31 protein [Prevotella sp.]|nr:glycoside hydrolase family 31 protein [Prevotella sp.]
MRRILEVFGFLCFAIWAQAATVEQTDGYVVIRPDGGGARVVRLQVVGDAIIRVQATSESQLPQKPQSLMVVEQTTKPKYTVSDEGGEVRISTSRVQAVVSKQTGRVRFLDAQGNSIVNEARDGKSFAPYRVPDREIGVDIDRVNDAQRNALSWRMAFDLQADEALYGLGQHQSEELNMRGKNEDLFQYNTKVSVPFVISSRNYGILWDSYSYCRFGQPEDYLQLNRAFRLYDKQGREGHLTGTYTDKDGRTLVRDEDSLYYEYDVPQASELCRQYDRGGIQNLPEGFKLKGATVVYEGFIEPRTNQTSPPLEGLGEAHFILYYAGYIKVYIGGELVVPERWRTAWNPNTYKFTARIPDKGKTQLRIEWQPDGDVSYCGLRVASPQTAEQQGQLSVWSEMARDMDYYLIAGASMDEVISGYRTLTGRAPVYPKWALGFWQSRERYKTQQEIVETLGEFRRRQIPIDNIVQDWNYWPEDQWGSHRFEAARYPNPQQMLDSVHKMGGRFMISVWPKFYCNTANYKELDAKGWMYHQAVVDDIHDWVGPGYVGSFYDAYSDGARKMFWRQMDENLYTGLSGKILNGKSSNSKYIDAWWMDASEPNVRDCTPMWYRKALSGPTALGTATEYFNAYSIVNADAIYNGQRSVNPNQRVFLLTRSGFAGLQRYSTATWSGDIGTRWEDMRAQMTAGMNYSLSGLPFWGMDQGGFCVEDRYMAAQGNYEKTGVENDDLKEWRELQARWSQFGAFIPLFRVHGQWPLREIWNLAPEEHPCYRSFVYYDQLRYRLMPYLYSMTGWVHLSDYTMMRALVMDFGSDTETHDIKDQWMFGPSLMACPVSEYKARSRAVYFPKGRGWYDLYTGEQIVNSKYVNRKLIVDAPYERIPVFVPEGSIIPFGPAMQWSDEQPAELINLYVYAGRDAQFTLYEDEGTNYNYEKGRYATIDITYDDASRTLTIGKRSGQFDGILKQRRFNVVYVTKDLPRPLNVENPEGTMVSYNGKAVSVELK